MSGDLSTWIDALAGGDLAARRTAAEKLSQAGEEARGAAVPLVRTVADDDEAVREHAIAALEGLGASDPADAASLGELAADPHGDVAYWAITLLGRSGAAAQPQAAQLAAVLTGATDKAVRQRAAWALGQIGARHEAVLSALNAAAASDDPRLARLAASALERLAEAA